MFPSWCVNGIDLRKNVRKEEGKEGLIKKRL
jgi:hypothetical protein